MSHTETEGLNCLECRSYFEPRRSDQAFCSTKCNSANEARALKRARRVYRALYHWRLEHKTFGQNMRFVCQEVASWIREDRASQRPPPPQHDHDSNRGHQREPQGITLGRKAA